MARQLPVLIDDFFLRLQAAALGVYQPTERPKPDRPYEAVNQRLDAFGARATKLMQRYQETRGLR